MPALQPRRLPVVFRFAAVLLGFAALAGGWWQHQPGARATHLLLRTLAYHCPAAVRTGAPVTVATGARTLDDVAWAMMMDRLAPQQSSRCTGKDKGQQTEGRG